jgi:Mlc titration factor MtfA (ptsG expression regulator)
MKITTLFAGAALCFAAACGKGGNSDFEAFHKLDTDKAAAFAVGGKDCKAKAKSVGDWRTAHSAEYKALQKKLNEAWGKKPPEDIIEKYGAEMQANKKAVVSAMFDCSSDPDFGKMMDATKD